MSLDVNRVQAICFDVDGTLRDTDDQFVAKISDWLAFIRFLLPGRNPTMTARRLVMKLESPATTIFGIPDRLGIDHYLVRVVEFISRLINPIPQASHHPLIPGVRESLALLSVYYPLAIISNRDEKSVREFIKAHQLDPFFQYIVTGQTCRYAKPNPEPVFLAAEKMGVLVEHCLLVGDTTVDMQSGKRAGAQTVGVLCGFGEKDELVRAGADMILPSPVELVSVLQDGKRV